MEEDGGFERRDGFERFSEKRSRAVIEGEEGDRVRGSMQGERAPREERGVMFEEEVRDSFRGDRGLEGSGFEMLDKDFGIRGVREGFKRAVFEEDISFESLKEATFIFEGEGAVTESDRARGLVIRRGDFDKGGGRRGERGFKREVFKYSAMRGVRDEDSGVVRVILRGGFRGVGSIEESFIGGRPILGEGKRGLRGERGLDSLEGIKDILSRGRGSWDKVFEGDFTDSLIEEEEVIIDSFGDEGRSGIRPKL